VPNRRVTALLIFLLAISFYVFTLSPSIAWGDGIRLQSEAISGESFILSEMPADQFQPDPFPYSKVGITAWDHPLYIVLGHALTEAFPSIDSIWLVNLISAVCGAAAVTLVFSLSYQFTSSRVASAYAALALAVSHTFWWHSSTPEVYTLFAFLLLACIYFFDKFERTGKYWALTTSAFFLGLAATDHVLAGLVVPAFPIYLLLRKRSLRIQIQDWRRLVPPVLAFVVGFSLYIVQFIRITRSFPLGEIMGTAVGSTFLKGLGAFSPALIAESLFTYLLYLLIQFGPLGIFLGAVGIHKLRDGADPSLWKIVALYIVYTIFGILYRVTDQFAFFLTSHVFFALLMGIGAAYVLAVLKTRGRLALTSILALSIFVTPLFYHAIPRLAKLNGIGDSAMNIPQIGTGLRDGLAYYIDPNKRGDFSAYDFGSETIKHFAPNAVVIAEWYTDTDEYFVLRYFHKIMGVRPDVAIFGFPTDDPFSFDPQLVLTVIQNSSPERPVYLASLSERFYEASKLLDAYCVVPENNLYRLYPKETQGAACLGKDSATQ
jgi:transmembrane protein TMEM260 (protein O-mannosyltransferase)